MARKNGTRAADLPAASYTFSFQAQYANKPGMLARFAACLKPGGRFVLVTKNAGWQDHREAQASARNVDPEKVDRSIRLQSGVVEWGTLGPMARAAGFREVAIHPVVIGTYRGFMRNRAALAAFDLVHRWAYRRPMTHSLDRWTESVTYVSGMKLSPM